MNGRRLRLILEIFALLVYAAGCGSGSKKDAQPASTTAHVVRIGVIAPLDGGATSFGRGIRDSVQLAVDEANARLAIPGWTIAVSAQDDSSDPAKGERAANTLAADPSVVGVIGTYNSDVTWQAAPVLDRAGIAMISPANTDPSLTIGNDRAHPRRQFGSYFRLVATNADEGPFLAQYARTNLRARRVAIVSETSSLGRGLATDFDAAFTAGGGNVVFADSVADNSGNFASVVRQIRSRRPDLLFFGGGYQSAAAFRSSAARVSVPMMGGDAMKDDAYIRSAGAASEGDLASTVGAPVGSDKSSVAFAFKYNAAHFADPPSDFGSYAYDAANLLIDAAAHILLAEPAITPSVRVDIVHALQADPEFDAFGDARDPLLTIYRVEQRAWVPVFTGTVR